MSKIDNIIQENEDFIIHWIEIGKTKTWIAKYLGISISGLSDGLKRNNIDYQHIKTQAAVEQKNEKLIEENKENKSFRNKIIDDNFDYLIDCLVNDTHLSIAAKKLNVNREILNDALIPYGIFLPGVVNTQIIQEKHNRKGSKGEQRIREILIENDIAFKEQYTFEDCTFPDTNQKARFDFCVYNNFGDIDYLIEYDGLQHTQKVDFWGGEEGLEKRKEHDKIKNDYCYFHNFTLIRIPYTVEIDSLNINDLIPNTSNYVI